MEKFLIFGFAAILVAGACAASIDVMEQIDYIEAADPKLVAELRKLAPEFVKLTEILEQRLGSEHSHEENIKIAKELLTKAESGCIGSCLAGGSWRKALEVYVALESTLGRCDTESYEILMKNYIAIELANKGANLNRARDALDYYHVQHYLACHQLREQKFSQDSEYDPSITPVWVERTFQNLDAHYFDPPQGIDFKNDFFSMAEPKLSKFHQAQVAIASQVLAQARDDNEEQPLIAKNLFDQYLFEACKQFNQQLGSALREAGSDATHFIEKNGYFRGDNKFHQTLIQIRLCASLLEEQEQLYKPLEEALGVVLREEVY